MTLRTPTALTDTQQTAADCQKLYAAGIRRLAYQVTNEGNPPKSFDTLSATDAGLQVDVWGCFYNQANFAREGASLGQQALAHGANQVIVDAEYCLKNTRGTGIAKGLVGAIQTLGSYPGPVSLTPMAAPLDPKVDDYAYDEKAFTSTGGLILCQAPYPQDAPAGVVYPQWQDNSSYNLTNALTYWRRFVKDTDLLPLVGLHTVNGLRQTGSDAARLIKASGWTGPVGVFQAQNLLSEDADALGPWLQPKAPQLSARATRVAMEEIAKPWAAPVGTYGRIGIARRIVALANTDKVWLGGDVLLPSKLKALLDSYGVPN